MTVHVITGATAGMGASVAAELCRRGEHVVGVGRSAPPAQLVAANTNEPGSYVHIAGDLADPSTLAAVVDAVAGRTVGGVVHAGATPIDFAPWVDIEGAELVNHFAVHVAAPIDLTRALRAAGAVERLLIFDSYSATTPRPQWSAYSIIKAAAQMSFRAATNELADTVAVRVFPGAVATPLLQRVFDAPPDVDAADFYRTLADQGKVSDPDDIAVGVADLLAEPTESLRAQPERHLGHSAVVECSTWSAGHADLSQTLKARPAAPKITGRPRERSLSSLRSLVRAGNEFPCAPPPIVRLRSSR